MTLTDEVLMAYADGELDTKARIEVEDAMAADPWVARRVAEHKAVRNTLRSSFDQVLDEPIPERLLAAARSGASRVVVPLRPRRAPSPPSLPFWGAIAASFMVGALVWHFGAGLYPTDTITERNGQLLASGALDRALSNQLVSQQAAQAPVRIGITFRSKSGSYCRTFELRGQTNLGGLACREQDRWRVQVLAQGETSQTGHPEFRPAGSSLPPAIAQAVDQDIAGEPLDAEAEAHARANQWRAR